MPVPKENRKQYHADYIRKHYQNNKEYYRLRNKENDRKTREYIRKVKDVPCSDCGLKYPYYVMDFDHKENKVFNLNQAKRKGINKIKLEISKCDVVCANCHRIRTHKRLSL